MKRCFRPPVAQGLDADCGFDPLPLFLSASSLSSPARTQHTAHDGIEAQSRIPAQERRFQSRTSPCQGFLHWTQFAAAVSAPSARTDHRSLAAKKIKDTLIHKATIKRQYYKDLKAEGYGDGNMISGTGSNGGVLGQRGVAEEGGAGDDEADQGDDDGNATPASASPAAASSKGKARSRPSSSSSRLQPPKISAPTASTSTSTPTPSLPLKRPRLSELEIKVLREKKKGERQDWVKRGAKGQPKLGGRVEMLLGRIKKSME